MFHRIVKHFLQSTRKMATIDSSVSAEHLDRKQKVKRSQQYKAVVRDNQWPIIYSPEYNISFYGLEKIHPFDSKKWGRIFKMLKDAGMLREDTIIEPVEATEDDLVTVHTKQYLRSLNWSFNVARITEVAPVLFLPNFVVQKKLLRPFRYQTSGTIMAGRLAVERGWAINIGGGFHHCSSDRGGGFCAYADITLAVKYAFDNLEQVSKVMIVDLDAHQGNGHERDFLHDSRVYIFDVYNRGIYPNDNFAKRAISRKVELRSFTGDEIYLKLVAVNLEKALEECHPDLVVYNAGTDILEHDPLGNLSITPEGVIERDQIVFKKVRSRNIPIFMLTSGGYLPQSAEVVANSIQNLRNKGLISCEAAEELNKQDVSQRRSRHLFARFRKFCLGRSSTSTENMSQYGSSVITTGASEMAGTGASLMISTELSDKSSTGASDMASIGASDMASTGASDKTSTGASDMASTGASDKTSTGASDIASIGASDIASTGASDMASTGTSDIASTGTSDVNSTGASTVTSTVARE